VNQKVLQRQLHNRGIMTEVANHGGEAIERLRASQFWKGALPDALDINVVLMDKEMPVMDGLVCTSKIRELEKAGELQRHVPIIAVTANARSEQIATLLAAGMVSRPGFLMLRVGPELTNSRTTLYRNPSALAT
jgi:CheY-like chemotaxis protein